MSEKNTTDSFACYYDRLNKEQKKAVDTVEGPLLVLAGPGTGKTQLLSVRAANIIRQKKASPENILILTFTNAAARAMRERLASMIGHEGYSVEVETFHSFANSIVLESEEAINYVKDKIEISEIEKIRAFEHIIDNEEGIRGLRPFGAPYIHRREIEKKISELKNEGIHPDELKDKIKDFSPNGVTLEEKHITRLEELARIYEKYEKLKDEKSSLLFDERGRIDYDDMILIALDALKSEEDLRKEFNQKYKYIMVDEYQDTNGAQLEMLFSILSGDKPNICCVGDDDQAIYRFQGATLANFHKLKDRYPEIETISLKNNYRSNSDIVNLSGEIISQLPSEERVAAKKLVSCRDYEARKINFLEFSTEEEELAFMVEEIRRQAESIRHDASLSEEEREKPYNNIAILVRKRVYILKLVDAFLKAGIPYATDGAEDIRQEKRVRQMLDVLELANPEIDSNERKSLSLYKVLTSDYLEATHSDVLKLINFVNRKRQTGQGNNILSENFYQQFLEHFGSFEKDMNDDLIEPNEEDHKKLDICVKDGLEFDNGYALHRAGWVIRRLLADASARPVHDMLLKFVDDARLYRFILKRYGKDKVLRVRDLRAIVSFINMVKKSDLANPALGLSDFMREMELREIHGMPVKGELATMSQDGVRIYTAHASKGLEFYTVFLPFCLEKKSWPVRRKGEVIRLPLEVYKSRERIKEKGKIGLLDHYDELRLFYVASTRAKANLIYTATPAEKVVISQFFEKMSINPSSGVCDNEEDIFHKFLDTSGGKDPFTGTEDVLTDLVSSLTLNPTSLNNYINCRRKFLYDNVLRLPGKKNQHLIFGNCAHKALEDVYSAYMDTKVFPRFDFFKASFKQELNYQGASNAIRNWCDSRLDQLEGWYEKEAKDPVMPIDLENKIEMHLPDGLVFRGTFDKIEKDTLGRIKVVDYKTGKPDKHVKAIANCRDLESNKCDDYYRQLIAYKLLYDKAGPGDCVVSKGVLQFLEKTATSVKKYGLEMGAYRNEEVELTDGMVEELERVLAKCWRDIRALQFEKLPERDGKERCTRCEYDHICWGDEI